MHCVNTLNIGNDYIYISKIEKQFHSNILLKNKMRIAQSKPFLFFNHGCAITCIAMENYVMLSRSNNGFHRIFTICLVKKGQNNTPLHMTKASNKRCMAARLMLFCRNY